MHRLLIALSLLFALRAAASNDLTGVVVDALAKPVKGAHVYVYTAYPKVGWSAFCPSCYRDCGKHEPVDAKGTFRVAAMDPTLVFDVLAIADGYEPSFARHVDPSRGAVTIGLEPRSTPDADRMISGIVVDCDGKPVVGAVVEPNGYRTSNPPGAKARLPRPVTVYGNVPGVDKVSITDAKGAFALRIAEAEAMLDVRVTARSLAPRIDRMLVPGELRTIQMTDGATISGHVARGGKPVAGARVAFVQRNRASSGYLGRTEIATAEDGLFVMTNLGPNETYIISVPADGVAGGVVDPSMVTVGGDGTDIDAGTLAVVPGRRVAGTIVVAQGVPVPAHMRITLTNELTGESREAEVGEDRRFVFDAVPAGPTRITAGRFGPRRAHVDVPEKGDVTDARLVLDR